MGIELLFILFLCLLVCGPKKLPEISRQIGRVYAEFKRVSQSLQWQLEAEVRKLETGTQNVAAPVPIGNPLAGTGPANDNAMDAETVLKLLLADAAANDATEKARSALVPDVVTVPPESPEGMNVEAISPAETHLGLPVQCTADSVAIAEPREKTADMCSV